MDDAALHRLLAQAYLFDDPAAYEAGVRDAVEALSGPRARTEIGVAGAPAPVPGRRPA
jgi:hypothetical protein